jgi:hypothetical protein
MTAVSGLTPAPMKFAVSTPAFDRALSVEIAASEQIRMRVLAGTLAIPGPGNDINAWSPGFHKAPTRGPASLVAIPLYPAGARRWRPAGRPYV